MKHPSRAPDACLSEPQSQTKHNPPKKNNTLNAVYTDHYLFKPGFVPRVHTKRTQQCKNGAEPCKNRVEPSRNRADRLVGSIFYSHPGPLGLGICFCEVYWLFEDTRGPPSGQAHRRACGPTAPCRGRSLISLLRLEHTHAYLGWT